MEKSDVRRNQILKIIAALPEDDGTSIVSSLFEPLRIELVNLVSEEGFHSLFERSVFLTCRRYSWFNAPQLLATAPALSNLEGALRQGDPKEARKAAISLLLNFVDLLASLIGEPLLIDILCSAWGRDALGSLAGEH
jgi:hypothetical protein